MWFRQLRERQRHPKTSRSSPWPSLSASYFLVQEVLKEIIIINFQGKSICCWSPAAWGDSLGLGGDHSKRLDSQFMVKGVSVLKHSKKPNSTICKDCKICKISCYISWPNAEPIALASVQWHAAAGKYFKWIMSSLFSQWLYSNNFHCLKYAKFPVKAGGWGRILHAPSPEIFRKTIA